VELREVSNDLEARIRDAKSWFDRAAGTEMPGPLLRSCAATAQLHEFLDAPRRAERYGLGFLVRVSAPTEPFSLQVNIRIKPQRTAGSKQDSYPYVANYVVDQSSSTELLLSFDHITKRTNYASYLGLTVEDWYLRRLALILEQGDGTLFLPEARIAT
jgi:hypothetical protein